MSMYSVKVDCSVGSFTGAYNTLPTRDEVKAGISGVDLIPEIKVELKRVVTAVRVWPMRLVSRRTEIVREASGRKIGSISFSVAR
jgi:hypothetical protein